MPAFNPGPTNMTYGDYSFLPVPVFSESVEIVRDAKLDQLFKRTTRDFTGVLLGQPAESGTFVDLVAAKDQLIAALGSGNQEFRISYAGNVLVSGQFPRINGPVFQEGTWANRIDYTFTAEIDEEVEAAVQSFNESWTFEESEDRRSVTVRHDLGAVGVNTNPSGTNNSFENARGYVLARTGFANAQANSPFFVQVSGTPFAAYEELRSETHDIAQGAFNVGETFILSSGVFTHTRTAQFSTDDNGVTTVTLNGNIKGLGRNGDDIAFSRALDAFSNQIRPAFAADASGIYSQFGGDATLFTSNTSNFSVTRNRFAGTVDYTIAFSDSESENLPSGILDFSLGVQVQEPVRVFASFPIAERSLGNVVQDVGTSNPGTFSIQGNAVGKPGFSFNALLAFVEDKINEKRPNQNNYVTLIPASQSVTKDEINNTVQFNIQWQFTEELSQVFGDGSAPVVIT